MRIITTLSAAIIAATLSAQETVTLTTGAANNTQTWYSLQNGEVAARSLLEWDLAIEIGGITGSILVNTAKGIEVYQTPQTIADWDEVDMGGMDTWQQVHNRETDWSSGALNQNLLPNPFHLGWGTYNMVTHNVIGERVFVLRLDDTEWVKLRIDGYASATDTYTFTWAQLDGTNEQQGTLVRSAFAGRNFGYASLADNTLIDREPATDEWDLLFTKYMAFVEQPVPSMYPVAGVLQNRDRPARRVDGVGVDYVDWNSGPMTTDINVIGFDWKSFNMETFQWEFTTDRAHFVQDGAGNIWKLIFTGYGGSATGDITFTQELLSATSVNELDGTMPMALYPNPVTDGRVNLVLDAPVSTVDMLVFDANGRVVLTERLAGLGGMEVRMLDVSNLRPGLYTVRLQGDGVLATQRLVVQ